MRIRMNIVDISIIYGQILKERIAIKLFNLKNRMESDLVALVGWNIYFAQHNGKKNNWWKDNHLNYKKHMTVPQNKLWTELELAVY